MKARFSRLVLTGQSGEQLMLYMIVRNSILFRSDYLVAFYYFTGHIP